MRSVVLLG
jgi:hypothetical protein